MVKQPKQILAPTGNHYLGLEGLREEVRVPEPRNQDCLRSQNHSSPYSLEKDLAPPETLPKAERNEEENSQASSSQALLSSADLSTQHPGGVEAHRGWCLEVQGRGKAADADQSNESHGSLHSLASPAMES